MTDKDFEERVNYFVDAINKLQDKLKVRIIKADDNGITVGSEADWKALMRKKTIKEIERLGTRIKK